ncbi:hypothetical protein ACIG56_30050 [Nocardia fusca]|uniref:hypothetical protein n=1 Tax=Nocardia fusca TaxID=941183 RepID=UPI0037CC3240
MNRNSPAVQKALNDWKQGYTPTEWAERVLRSQYRNEMEMALARLIRIVSSDRDELEILPSVQSFAEFVTRADANLRHSLAGDRWTDTGRAGASPQTKGGAAA